MNFREMERRITARISGLEAEETRLQEALICLRRLPLIAAEWKVDLSSGSMICRDPVIAAEEILHSEIGEQGKPSAELFKERITLETKERVAEDPLDRLRQRLNRKPERTSKPVFTSRILSEARV